jgi:hypothetical protein
MRDLPPTENALVLRTDFSDDGAWDRICAAVQEEVGEFRAYVTCVSDREYEGLTTERLMSLEPYKDLKPYDVSERDSGQFRTFFFMVDRIALTHPERPILVIDLFEEPGRTFRVVASEMWGVENNLSGGNMDFSEFADNTGEDGIFRGFP